MNGGKAIVRIARPLLTGAEQQLRRGIVVTWDWLNDGVKVVLPAMNGLTLPAFNTRD